MRALTTMGRMLIYCAKSKLVTYPDGMRKYFTDHLAELVQKLDPLHHEQPEEEPPKDKIEKEETHHQTAGGVGVLAKLLKMPSVTHEDYGILHEGHQIMKQFHTFKRYFP